MELNRKQRRAAARAGETGQQVPPMQEIWPVATAELTAADEDGQRALVVLVPRPFKMMVFSLSAENVQALGEQARDVPHVETATVDEAAALTGGGVLLDGTPRTAVAV
jgi:hypothetical protein